MGNDTVEINAKTGISHYQEYVAKVKKMTLMSDAFASVVFENRLAVQDVLRILTGDKSIVLKTVLPQKSIRNLYGHSSVLDVWAEDVFGRQYNLEIQNEDVDDHVRRTRYIQGQIDTRIFPKGEKYRQMPELYLIFISRRDFLAMKTYKVEVHRGANQKPGVQIANGVHELYINLQYPPEEDDVRRLLQYMQNTNNEEIDTCGFENLAAEVKNLKEEKGGLKHMCEVMDKIREEGREEGNILHLITQTMKKQNRGMMSDEIADALEAEPNVIEQILMAAAESGSENSEKIYSCMLKCD